MPNSRIRLKDKESLNLYTVEPTDTIGQMIHKLNFNFLEIINNGGGPMGPMGPMGVPGARGQSGPPGKDGENVLDEWSSRISLGCNLLENYGSDDVIINKHINKTFLLSNLSELDGIFTIKQIYDEGYTSPIVSNTFSDYKMKIYNSDNEYNGKHIHLLNSKAITLDDEYLCKSGFTFDLNILGNSETLKIQGQKNNNIINHKHNIDLLSDKINITRDTDKQILQIDAGNGTEFIGTLEQKTLTKNNSRTIPDRTGYIGVWEDTLSNGETWEVISNDDINIVYARYFINDSDEARETNHQIYKDENSEIRFKRLNSFIIVDFHIGIRRIEEFDDFFIKNLQFKVNIPSLGARTIGWYPFSILGSESFEDDLEYTNHGYFKLTPTDIDSGINNTFLLSLKFKKNEMLPFISSRLEEDYWLSGQVWGTELSEDPSCIQLTIEQDDLCPYLEIIG